MAIHQCPRCELRFMSSSELEWHLVEDHGSPPLATPSAASRPGIHAVSAPGQWILKPT